MSGAREYEIREIPMKDIKRPVFPMLDLKKVACLKESIAEEGLHVPIDVLEVNGQYWSFGGCHRWEAHQQLGKETIKCKIIPATPDIIKMHLGVSYR